MGQDLTIEVEDQPDKQRFVVVVNGEDAGGAYYRWHPHPDGDRRVYTHTEVDERFEGQGVGSALARVALDISGESGEKVVPLCPFIQRYIERHAEYQGLVDEELRSDLGKP